MNDGLTGCLGFLLAVVVVGVLAGGAIALNNAGVKTGRQMQFCIDHAGQWDDVNVRCLKSADTVTVQVPK